MFVHDVSICYTARDREFANLIFLMLDQQGLSVFLASLANDIGEGGAAVISANLRASRWAILLAGEEACERLNIWHNEGVAFLHGVKIVSVVWGGDAFALPAWIDREYVLNLSDDSVSQMQNRVAQMADALGADRSDGALIFGTMLTAFVSRSIERGAT